MCTRKTGRKIAAGSANIYVSLPVYAQSTIIFIVKHAISGRYAEIGSSIGAGPAKHFANTFCAMRAFATANDALLVLSFAAKRPATHHQPV